MMRAHPHAGTPQYRQAYPPPAKVQHQHGSVGRKRTSGAAALAVKGDGWTRITHWRAPTL